MKLNEKFLELVTIISTVCFPLGKSILENIIFLTLG